MRGERRQQIIRWIALSGFPDSKWSYSQNCCTDQGADGGNSRIVLGWQVRAGNLFGALSVERERRNAYDKQFWESVWGLVVPQYDAPYSGSGDATVTIHLDMNYSNARNNAVFSALMSILYGLTNGPVKV